MARARTWILIIFASIGAIVIFLMVAAGVGTFWLMRHISTQPATATSAVKTFDQERARFGTEPALLNLDDLDNGFAIQKKIDSLPASPTPATEMGILVWSPDNNRTVRIALPFWLLRLGRKKITISGADSFDFDRLKIDVGQLERIGPRLIADIERPGGERVLIWTK